MIKKRRIDYFFFSLALFAFSSCSDDTDEKLADDGSMIAKVDGTNWQSTLATAQIYNGQISVIGESSDGSHLVVSVKGTTVGDYAIAGASISADNLVSFTPANADVMNNPTYSSTYFEEEGIGEIKITEIDDVNKTISGTFHSKVKRFKPEEVTIEIKAGSFTSIPYDEEPGGATGSSFSAKVNGSAFSPSLVGGSQGFGTVTINATASGNKSITINVPDDTNTGTFSFDTFGSDYYATYSVSSTVYESVSGTLVITKHDKANDRIEGTFNFTGELFPSGGGSLSVTEGSFAVSY